MFCVLFFEGAKLLKRRAFQKWNAKIVLEKGDCGAWKVLKSIWTRKIAERQKIAAAKPCLPAQPSV